MVEEELEEEEGEEEKEEEEDKMLCVHDLKHFLSFSSSQSVCSAIAVVLHYLFLVVFMWMLMEGVVLYVALIRVFIKFHERYIAAFTLASYGR